LIHDERYAFLTSRLRELREKGGLTQTQVAKSLGKPQSYVAKIELGERRIDVIELDEFARLYGVTVEDFIQGDR
jgi:transcriptional regulator with XRE-family HTH domain